jgi:hypothetical protein
MFKVSGEQFPESLPLTAYVPMKFKRENFLYEILVALFWLGSVFLAKKLTNRQSS